MCAFLWELPQVRMWHKLYFVGVLTGSALFDIGLGFGWWS